MQPHMHFDKFMVSEFDLNRRHVCCFLDSRFKKNIDICIALEFHSKENVPITIFTALSDLKGKHIFFLSEMVFNTFLGSSNHI